MNDLATVTTEALVAELESRRQEFGGESIPVIGKATVINILMKAGACSEDIKREIQTA